jgi:hypothetical protein
VGGDQRRLPISVQVIGRLTMLDNIETPCFGIATD